MTEVKKGISDFTRNFFHAYNLIMLIIFPCSQVTFSIFHPISFGHPGEKSKDVAHCEQSEHKTFCNHALKLAKNAF